MEAAARAEMAALVPAVSDVATRYEADLSRLVHHLRLEEHAAHPEIGAPEARPAEDAAAPDAGAFLLGVTDADAQTLLELRRAWFNAVGIQATRRRNAQFAAHLARLRDRRLGAAAPPPRAGRDRLIADAAAKLRTSGEVVAGL